MNPQAQPDSNPPNYAEGSPPIRFGLKRAYYQYSTSIPQSHLVLVSVLEGIVFGVLLINNLTLPRFSGVVTLGYSLKVFLAIAPFIATSLIILLTWTDFVYASTVLIWPPSIQQTALIYMASVPQIVAARAINNFPVWVVGCSLVTLVAALVRFNNRLIFRAYDFEDEHLGANLLRREIYYGWLYTGLGLLGLVLISLYGVARAGLHSFPMVTNPDDFLQGFGYLLVLLLEAFLILLVARYQEYFLANITKGTDLEVTRFGGLRHRRAAQQPQEKAV
jgi:hypothetical protein